MTAPALLAVVEFFGHAQFKAVYEACGYQVSQEYSVRRAISLLRKLKPAVVVADFYFQPDFRDRVSNLESLLATVQGLSAKPRVLVFYEPGHQAALDKVRQRFHIDAALPMPVQEAELRRFLK